MCGEALHSGTLYSGTLYSGTLYSGTLSANHLDATCFVGCVGASDSVPAWMSHATNNFSTSCRWYEVHAKWDTKVLPASTASMPLSPLPLLLLPLPLLPLLLLPLLMLPLPQEIVLNLRQVAVPV